MTRLRMRKAQTAAIFKNHEKKHFRQWNFHITIFHLSLADWRRMKLLMRWIRDSSSFSLFYSLVGVKRWNVTLIKNASHTYTQQEKKNERKNEWMGWRSCWFVDASHSGHISFSKCLSLIFRANFHVQMCERTRPTNGSMAKCLNSMR